MTLCEITLVLAHELGHFSQGMGMRFALLIHKILRWFAHVVYERDSWDDRLARWSKDRSWIVSIIGAFATIVVRWTRRVLWLLMYSGHAVASYFSRQMEYDADAIAIEVVGSETFVSETYSLAELSAANELAVRRLGAVSSEQDPTRSKGHAAWLGAGFDRRKAHASRRACPVRERREPTPRSARPSELTPRTKPAHDDAGLGGMPISRATRNQRGGRPPRGRPAAIAS